jgi:hypothetical protein
MTFCGAAERKKKKEQLYARRKKQLVKAAVFKKSVRQYTPTFGERAVLARAAEGVHEFFSRKFANMPHLAPTFQEIQQAFSLGGIVNSLASLEYHRKRLATYSSTRTQSRRGRPKSVSDDEIMMMVAYAVHMSRVGKQVSLQDVCEWMNDELNVDVCIATVRKYLTQNGISCKVARTSSSANAPNLQSQMTEALELVADMIKRFFYLANLSKIFTIDGTFSAHKSETRRTWAPMAGCGLRVRICIPKYTLTSFHFFFHQ